MADNTSHGWESGPPSPPKRHSGGRWRPHWRLFTWVILAFNLVMLLWLIFGIAEANKDICATKPPEVQDACRVGSDVGTVLGVGAIVFEPWRKEDRVRDFVHRNTTALTSM